VYASLGSVCHSNWAHRKQGQVERRRQSIS
jgi:hypothetical protein